MGGGRTHHRKNNRRVLKMRSIDVRLGVLVVPPHDRHAKVRQDSHQRKQYCPDNEGTHGGKQRVRAEK